MRTMGDLHILNGNPADFMKRLLALVVLVSLSYAGDKKLDQNYFFANATLSLPVTTNFANTLTFGFSSTNSALPKEISMLKRTTNSPVAGLLKPWPVDQPAPVRLLEPWVVGDPVPLVFLDSKNPSLQKTLPETAPTSPASLRLLTTDNATR
jgi:hypothetical protein